MPPKESRNPHRRMGKDENRRGDGAWGPHIPGNKTSASLQSRSRLLESKRRTQIKSIGEETLRSHLA